MYDLNTNLEWTRRAGGDPPRTVQEEYLHEGGTRLFTNSPISAITLIEADGSTVSSGDYSSVGNVITFTSSYPAETEFYVSYTTTQYTDAEVLSHLEDASNLVGGELHVFWTVASGIITDPHGVLTNGNSETEAGIIKLIVMRAAMSMLSDRAMDAVDSGVSVRDCDTAINTTARAGGFEKMLARLQKQYDQCLKMVRISMFGGKTKRLDDHRDWNLT